MLRGAGLRSYLSTVLRVCQAYEDQFYLSSFTFVDHLIYQTGYPLGTLIIILQVATKVHAFKRVLCKVDLIANFKQIQVTL